MFYALVAIIVVVFFIAGMVFFRKHGDRIEADAAKVSAVVQSVKDTTKAL